MKVCKECGELFKKPYHESMSRFERRLFCSQKCSGRASMVRECLKCEDCGLWMRPYRGLVVDFPGCVARSSSKRCKGCTDVAKMSGPPDPVTVAGLVRLLSDRRRRGVPAEGFLMAGEKPNEFLEELISY